LTFHRSGGRQEQGVSTYILDEASMLDLGLTATLFRAVHWGTVQRLIFVGDPNQLPPIGRGKLFADVVDWLTAEHRESVGVLQINLRQMENRLSNRGTGILDLASLYTRNTQSRSLNVTDEDTDIVPEVMLKRIQEGGEVDRDLRVLYWKDPDELAQLLTSTIVGDMETDAGTKIDPARNTCRSSPHIVESSLAPIPLTFCCNTISIRTWPSVAGWTGLLSSIR
jgi:hypothetical protein